MTDLAHCVYSCLGALLDRSVGAIPFWHVRDSLFVLPFLFFLFLFFLSRMCVIAYTSQDIPWICFAVSFHKTARVVSEAFTWCT